MPITFLNLIFYLPNSFKKHSVFLIGLGIISLIFFLFVIAIPSVTAVVDDRCDYTWGCPSNWMGAGDGCDCTSSGTVCSADTDCPAPASVVDPECDYTLGCPANYMGAGDGCDCTSSGTVCSADTDCPSNAPTCSTSEGDSCNRNNVDEGTGVIQCDGTCSTASAPADRALSCGGGAGGSLSAGINYGAFPEYYKIYNAWNNVTCGPSNIYSCPDGTTEVKVRLSYSTESGYDFVKIYNGAGDLLRSFSGNSGGYTWKGPFSTSSLKFGFTSDFSIPGGNFNIWKIDCIVSPDNTNPSINVSGAPDSWQNTNDRANINCTDSGSGCESIGNWKWLTRESYIGNCSSFNLTDYTGTYNQTKEDAGGINITNHVWFCATAMDTAGNRGYSFPVEFKIDKTDPDTPTITGPATGSWQNDPSFSVTVSGDGDSGGSQLANYYYHVWDVGVGGWTKSWATRSYPNRSATPLVGLSPDWCRTQGLNKCKVYVFAQDGAGNNGEMHGRTFSIDYSDPEVNIISQSTATTNVAKTFSATVSDAISGLSYCKLVVEDTIISGNMDIVGNTASKSHTFSSARDYDVHVSCEDIAGNYKVGTDRTVTVTDPTLDFPSGYWELLWYDDPKNNSFDVSSYLGRRTPGNINENWGGGILYEGQNSTIGFKASRTLTSLTPGAYTISVGADDGIKLFVNGSGNLLPSSAWNNNHSWSDNRHEVRVDLSSSATIEIHYRENTGDAKISFAYNFGVVPNSSLVCTEGRPNDTSIGCPISPVVPSYPACDFYQEGNICYYASSTACAINTCSETRNICSYNSVCTLQAGQACGSDGCVEGIPPTVSINITSGQWKKDNNDFSINVSAEDNIALASMEYKVGIGGDWYTPTTNGITSISVSGRTLYNTAWKIKNSDWNSMSEGENRIYVRAQDTSRNEVGYDNSKSFTVKKDSLFPTSTPNISTSGASFRTSDTTYWFKAGTYNIPTSDLENTSAGSGNYSGLNLSSCFYKIIDLVNGIETPLTTRTCGSTISLTVGIGLNCVAEGKDKCELELRSKDIAGNPGIFIQKLNIDYTAPQAE